MQITGWGRTKIPEYLPDETDRSRLKLINDVKNSRYLKLAYVSDHTLEDDESDPPIKCYNDGDKVEWICVHNQTLVLNSDFLPIFSSVLIFSLILPKPEKGEPPRFT